MTVGGSKTLSRADRLLRGRKFSQVISLLESQVFLYRENFTFYRLLGTACLYAGAYGGSYSYLQRAQQIKRGDMGVELGLAAVHLRRREIPEALAMWLSVLDRDPKNSRARRGLTLIRRTEDTSEFVTMAESGSLEKLYPPLGFHLPVWIPIVLVAAFLVAAAAFFLPDLLETRSDGRQPVREGGESIRRSELPAELIDPDRTARYTLSEHEVADLVERVGRLFNASRDNLARREANRLLLSNATPLVKERVRLVSRYFREPTFVDFQDNFTYEEVASEPWLYNGAYVRWSGQTRDIRVTGDAIRFTLLVGYEAERTLDGTVPVLVTDNRDIRPGGIELIGRISYRDGEIGLTATSTRPIVARAGR